MKKLYKIDEGKMIDGVCGGIAAYFDVDATLVRIIWAFFSLSGGGVLFYLICALIMPRESDVGY